MEKIEITVPDGVKVEIEGKRVTVTGEKGTTRRSFRVPSVDITGTGEGVEVSTPSKRKKDVAVLGTVRSRITNMIHGVQHGYEYKLKIYYAHFPMSVTVEGDRVKIDNFLGERYPRYAPITEGTTVDIQGDTVTVTGVDKERVGQTAANLEQATRIIRKDPRVFQDGIYLFERDGVKVK
ncbi:MAG: 50S ribosomal protein L6 [Theionarchaea archaeon]|nr:50S ribosomal protein L6 [Theionarchaea archaeon]